MNVCANTLSAHSCTNPGLAKVNVDLPGRPVVCRVIGEYGTGQWSEIGNGEGVQVLYTGSDNCDSGTGSGVIFILVRFVGHAPSHIVLTDESVLPCASLVVNHHQVVACIHSFFLHS